MSTRAHCRPFPQRASKKSSRGDGAAPAVAALSERCTSLFSTMATLRTAPLQPWAAHLLDFLDALSLPSRASERQPFRRAQAFRRAQGPELCRRSPEPAEGDAASAMAFDSESFPTFTHGFCRLSRARLCFPDRMQQKGAAGGRSVEPTARSIKVNPGK